jgi:hypothetical protein
MASPKPTPTSPDTGRESAGGDDSAAPTLGIYSPGAELIIDGDIDLADDGAIDVRSVMHDWEQMSKGKRVRTEREAVRLAHDYTQFSEGRWIGEVGKGGEADTAYPVAHELIRRFNDGAKDRLACPHLQKNPDQPKFWVEAVSELLACLDCTATLAETERKRANSCCVMCGRHDALRGVTVTVAGVVMRGGVCADCEASAGVAL